jgi:outer membrane receptor protein involved in Fe transport
MRAASWVLAVVLSACFLRGQSADSAAIRGQVLDETGASVPAASIRLINTATGLQRTAITNSSGHYAIADLPLTGVYRIEVTKAGFATKDVDSIRLRAGETASLNFTLAPETGHSDVLVLGTVEGVRTDSPQTGTYLDSLKIQETPVLGRKLTSLPLIDSAIRPARGSGDLFLGNTLFVINGSGRRQTSYVVDGANADDAWGRQTIFSNVPFAALQEVTVLTNAFSAEYGRNTGGVVNVNTISGTNDAHGDLLAMGRPGGIEARNPLSVRKTEDTLAQFSGAVAGPLLRNRTHFLLAAEYNHQNHDATITSPLAPGIYTGHIRQELGLARLDHQINDRNTVALRLSLDHLTDDNPNDAVGGLALPSAARIFERATYGAHVSETAILTPHIINQSRAEFLIGSPITRFDPVMPSTQFAIPGVATQGESRVANLQNHQWEMADTLSLNIGTHDVKLGADAIYSSSGGVGQEFGSPFYLGQFTLNPNFNKPFSQTTLADVQRFSQGFGNASYRVGEWLGAVFVQDNWKLRPDFTLNLGLRYDGQTFTDDRGDIQPRVGFAYNLPGDHRTVLRGSYGLYYSQLRANTAAAYRINGPEGIFTFSASPGQLGFPTSLAPLTAFPAGAVLPPRDIFIRPGEREFLSRFFDVSKLRGYADKLLNPGTQQFSVGIERELGAKWVLSADYTNQHTTRIDRPLDLNAPALFVRTAPGQIRSGAAADATRPIIPAPNGYRRIIATVNDGAAVYNGLVLNLNRRFSRNFSVLASYTYAHAINSVEPDVPGQDPNDANQRGRTERATSLLDQRHRFVLSGWWQFVRNWNAGMLSSLAAGRPYNITTGADNNGDNSTADRPVVNGVVIGRNAGRGTPVYDISTFVERAFPVGERIRISARAEAFNLLNHANVVGRNGVYGNDPGGVPLGTLGTALGGISNVDPGREFQFLVRVQF